MTLLTPYKYPFVYVVSTCDTFDTTVYQKKIFNVKYAIYVSAIS